MPFQVQDFIFTALHKRGGAHQTSNHLPKPNLETLKSLEKA